MPCDANFKNLPRNQKIYLMWLWGIEQIEIAVIFNITAGRVNNILNEMAPDRPKRGKNNEKRTKGASF